MDGFCESCGRRPTRLERLGGHGIARCVACELYTCRDCREHGRGWAHLAPRAPRRAAGLVAPDRGGLPRLIVAGVALAGGLAIVALLPSSGGPSSTGVMFGDAVVTGPPGGAVPTAATTASTMPAGGPPTPDTSPLPGIPAPGRPVIRDWLGPYGEMRVQVIVPVRNSGSGWLWLPRSDSSYRILDDKDREMASGLFAAVLPEFVGPGQTAYLIDTLSATFADPAEFERAEASVEGVAVEAPQWALSVDDIKVSTGPAGGMRAVGTVRNDAAVTAPWIIAGVIALDARGRPLGAVYDLTDIGQLRPGERRPFDTEYPGAPPVPDGGPASVVGIAFSSRN